MGNTKVTVADYYENAFRQEDVAVRMLTHTRKIVKECWKNLVELVEEDLLEMDGYKDEMKGLIQEYNTLILQNRRRVLKVKLCLQKYLGSENERKKEMWKQKVVEMSKEEEWNSAVERFMVMKERFEDLKVRVELSVKSCPRLSKRKKVIRALQAFSLSVAVVSTVLAIGSFAFAAAIPGVLDDIVLIPVGVVCGLVAAVSALTALLAGVSFIIATSLLKLQMLKLSLDKLTSQQKKIVKALQDMDVKIEIFSDNSMGPEFAKEIIKVIEGFEDVI